MQNRGTDWKGKSAYTQNPEGSKLLAGGKHSATTGSRPENTVRP